MTADQFTIALLMAGLFGALPGTVVGYAWGYTAGFFRARLLSAT